MTDEVAVANTVLVVEDDGDLRQYLRRVLSDHPSLELVGEAGNGEQALRAFDEQRPGIVVLDLGLPDMAGHDLITRIRQRGPWVRVVVYTGTSTSRSTVSGWGAQGLVRKDQDVSRLVRLLERIATEPLVVVMDLPRTTASIGAARRFVELTLHDWRCEALVLDTQLVASELVTNAVKHGGTDVGLRLSLAEGVLRVEVADHGAGSPELQPERLTQPGGRGLRIVSRLAAAWGIDPGENSGKVVWAELEA